MKVIYRGGLGRGRAGTQDVANNDKLLTKEPLPLRGRFTAPRHRLVDGPRADADYRREGPAGVAQDLDPEVRGSIPGATDAGAAAALPELRRAEAHRARSET